MTAIKTRFAPSPTGFLHLGGARTALFSYLYARRHGGKFVLRIEDTDQSRNLGESIEAITSGLSWLGIAWDEGPHLQSTRRAIYEDHLRRLLESGAAYRCRCTPEALEAKRQAALAEGRRPSYDGTCRGADVPAAEPHAIRFRVEPGGQTLIEDLVKGSVTFDNEEIDDFIVARSDGWPTYNFAVVVDDATMGITHVVRGEDLLPSTPKQIMLYRALGYPVPRFAHLPLVKGLSKRLGSPNLLSYRDEGFLPEAVMNYLARLGWSHGDQEIFSPQELAELFDLAAVGRAPAQADRQKMVWVNEQWIKRSSDERLAGLLPAYLARVGVGPEAGDEHLRAHLGGVVASLKDRAKTLAEMAAEARFYFEAPDSYDEKSVEKWWRPPAAEAVRRFLGGPATWEAEAFVADRLEAFFRDLAAELGVGLGKVAQPLRIAVVGTAVSPPIFQVLEILGISESKRRVAAARDRLGGDGA